MTCMKTWADWESNISPTPISMISLFTAASHIYTALITAYASDVSLKNGQDWPTIFSSKSQLHFHKL